MRLNWSYMLNITKKELNKWLQLKAFLGYYESGEKYDNEIKKLCRTCLISCYCSTYWY